MTELTLYRKYRPQSFQEVVGQDHIVSLLSRAIKEGKFAHAYLFAGSRGIGKTSVARILARALGTTEKDLYEIDGASNRGIEEIRELRDGVRTLPFESKFKVYIIDEVHMLTTPAFNALLKTLEEPPAHVIFVLATTEIAKVPETIVSRCETHIFRRPATENLVEQVKMIAKKEGHKIEPEAVRLIAFLGDGSFRDTIGIFQKVSGLAGDGAITAEKVSEVTGAPKLWLVFNFILAVLDGDTAGGLEILRRAAEENQDFNILSKLILQELRLAMLFFFASEMKDELIKDMSEEEILFLTNLSKRPDAKILPKVLKEFLAAHEDIGYAYLPQLPLELALIRIVESKKEKTNDKPEIN